MSLADLALPLVKQLPPEAAHTATIKGLKLGLGLPDISPASWNTPVKLPVSGLQLSNPVGLAAGFDKNADVHGPMSRFGFGFLECGTVTPKPQPGNPKPRVFRLTEDQGVINRLGFNNHGLDYFVRRLRRSRPRATCPVGANVGANKTSKDFIADYEIGIAAVYPVCNYITINVSSPNTPGLRGLQDKGALQELLTRCERAQTAAQSAYETDHGDDVDGWKPVFLKSVKIAAASGGRQQNRITSWLRQLLPQGTQNTLNDTMQSPPRRRQRTRQTQHVGAQPSRWVTTYMTSFMTRTQQTTQQVTNRASSTIGRWRTRGLSYQITNFFGRREPPNPQQEELDPSLGGDHPL